MRPRAQPVRVFFCSNPDDVEQMNRDNRVRPVTLALPKGPEIIATALAGTGLIFLGLSGYALTSKRDFSFMGGFLFAGIMLVFIAALANLFLALPALSLAVSGGIILLMSGFILFDTSRILTGGETNYLMATYGLYLNLQGGTVLAACRTFLVSGRGAAR